MKLIFNTILVFILTNTLSVQCNYNVNTCPNNPSNDNAPDTRFLNGFNWWEGEQIHNGGYAFLVSKRLTKNIMP